jgi:hypothetical protein
LKAHVAKLFRASLVLVLATAASGQGPAASSALTISPANVVFPTVPVGSEDAPQTVTIVNSTNSNIQLQELIVSGIDFAQSNDCANALASGAKCSIQIVFKPAIPGERIGNLEIVSSDSNVPHFVALNGTGQ